MKRFVIILLLLASVLSVNSFADAKKKTPPPTRGTIKAIDLATHTITVTLSSKSDPEIFTYDDQTTIEISGLTAPAKQIKVGMGIRSIRLNSDTPPLAEDLDLVATGK